MSRNINGIIFTYIMNNFISLRRPMQTNYENNDGFYYLYSILPTFEIFEIKCINNQATHSFRQVKR